MSLPRVPKMQQRARKTQALEALTHLRPLLRARRNHKKYLQNGFFNGLLVGNKQDPVTGCDCICTNNPSLAVFQSFFLILAKYLHNNPVMKPTSDMD